MIREKIKLTYQAETSIIDVPFELMKSKVDHAYQMGSKIIAISDGDMMRVMNLEHGLTFERYEIEVEDEEPDSTNVLDDTERNLVKEAFEKQYNHLVELAAQSDPEFLSLSNEEKTLIFEKFSSILMLDYAIIFSEDYEIWLCFNPHGGENDYQLRNPSLIACIEEAYDNLFAGK